MKTAVVITINGQTIEVPIRNGQVDIHMEIIEEKQAQKGENSDQRMINWKNIPEELLIALNTMINAPRVLRICKEIADEKLDIQDAWFLIKKNGIATSGYLYDYMESFWILALCEDKRILSDSLVAYKSMIRQLDAFCGGNGLRMGAFYIKRDAREREEIVKALETIQKYMPRCVQIPYLHWVQLKKSHPKMNVRLQRFIEKTVY